MIDIESQIAQAINHDYKTIVHTGLECSLAALPDNPGFNKNINDLLISALSSKVEGIKDAALVVAAHGLNNDLTELKYTGEEQRAVDSQDYLIKDISDNGSLECFGFQLLICACCKYASYDMAVWCTLFDLFNGFFHYVSERESN